MSPAVAGAMRQQSLAVQGHVVVRDRGLLGGNGRLLLLVAWLIALVLLLASTWLYQLPKSTPKSSGQVSVDRLFDTQPSAAQDDMLLAQEKGQ